MTARVERLAGEICHCDWVNCPGCGIEFRLLNSYDFVGQLRAAGWGVDWSKGGWWCRDCRRAAETGQGKLL
jgi:hypothetical protein